MVDFDGAGEEFLFQLPNPHIFPIALIPVYDWGMSLYIRTILTGFFALIAAFLLALAPADTKPMSGGCQLFSGSVSADQGRRLSARQLDNIIKLVQRGDYSELNDSIGAARPILPDGYKWVRDSDGNATIRDRDGNITADREAIDRVVTGDVGNAANKTQFIDDLVSGGTKITPENVVDIRKLPDGRTVWLETGSDTAGLRHIYKRHEVDFSNKGISREEISTVVMDAFE